MSDAVAMKDPLYEFSQDADYDFLALSDFDGSATNRPWDTNERRCPKFDHGGLDPMVAQIEVKICASTSVFYLRASEPGMVGGASTVFVWDLLQPGPPSLG